MIKVSVLNCWKLINSKNELLILKIIEKALNKEVKLTDLKDADLVLLYGFKEKSFKDRIVNKFIQKINKNNFNSIFGIPNDKLILAISHENLDSQAWHWFGHLLIKYNIPRLTFWPQIVDPDGCQFPYWYNYLTHEDLLMPNEFYNRFGEPLSIEKLMNPLSQKNDHRKDAICVLASHLNFPRMNLVENLKKIKQVDIYGAIGQKWNGNKIDLLREYKYCFCGENSIGYSYETEKVPEAWHAGCIPVGYIQSNPSEFNRNVLSILLENEQNTYKQPLLQKKPELTHVIHYIQKKFSGRI